METERRCKTCAMCFGDNDDKCLHYALAAWAGELPVSCFHSLHVRPGEQVARYKRDLERWVSQVEAESVAWQAFMHHAFASTEDWQDYQWRQWLLMSKLEVLDAALAELEVQGD